MSDHQIGGRNEEEYFVRVAAGSDLFREGESGNEMFIIREGQVEILKAFEGEDRVLAVLTEGDFFGEIAVLEDLPRCASARAQSDCVLLRIDRSTFDQIVRHNPEIAVRMLRKLLRRLRAANPLLLEVDLPLTGVPVGEAGDESPTESIPEHPAAARAWLVHEPSGQKFFLVPGDHTCIGRYDAVTGIRPDIDLMSVADERTISRRHAKIIHRAGRFLLCEEAAANGTFLNHRRIRTGEEVEIRDGDEISFGMLVTVFQAR